MRLSCTQCGGSVDAEPQALRRGYVTCSFCSTVLRVDEHGLLPLDAPLPPAPAGVRMAERGDRFEITARRKQFVIGKREVIAGGVVGLAALVVALVLFPGLGALAIAAVAFVGATVVAAWLRRGLPPVILTADHIEAGHGFSPRLPCEEVRQLYVTRTTMAHRDQENVFIQLLCLTRNDQRVQLIGPFADVNDALFVEATLEGRLGILDQAVRGSVAAPSPEPASVASEEAGKGAVAGEALTPPTNCASCGAALAAEAMDRRGWTVCTSCGGLSLAYPPGQGPLVGTPGWQSVSVEETPLGLTMTMNAGLDRAERWLVDGAAARTVVATSEGLTVGSKAVGRDDVLRLRIVPRQGTTIEGIGALARAQAHGGRVDLAETINNSERYEVVADLRSRREPVVLIPGLVDPREADRLRARMFERLGFAIHSSE